MIAVDSKDVAWVAYVADGKVWITHTLSAPTEWSTPLAFTAEEASVDATDVVAITAFGPGRIGVAWTNQRSGVHFVTHDDSAPDDQWSRIETILPGPKPDPTLNLTTYPLDAETTGVAAAVATTHDEAAGGRQLDALTFVAMRDASGDWATAASVTEPTIFSFVLTRSSRLMSPVRGTPAVITTTSEPAVGSYEVEPVTFGSYPSTAPAWLMSSALPSGSPSLMSTRTTSA